MQGARAKLFTEASPAKLLSGLRSCAALSKKIDSELDHPFTEAETSDPNVEDLRGLIVGKCKYAEQQRGKGNYFSKHLSFINPLVP
ncbi:unnamed protein product [Arabis nemorensis]|uniref:Uncharacterized protein n=1 Tax=Arabis nemorensis TaxID=586526 RepID=A0A565CE56_9BRAS|nr:unnamed protein product [Arabis nemorensis]